MNLPVEKIIEANRTAADTLSLDTPVGVLNMNSLKQLIFHKVSQDYNMVVFQIVYI